MKRRHIQAGMTLIELVIAITVISIAVLSVMSLFATAATRSGSSLINEQALSIASAYLQEITSKPYLDPNTDGESGRTNFDDVDDYNGVNDIGARNAQGVALAGLNQFTVNVRVGAGSLDTVPAAEVRRIDVTVRHSAGVVVSLSAYRTRDVP